MYHLLEKFAFRSFAFYLLLVFYAKETQASEIYDIYCQVKFVLIVYLNLYLSS